MSTAVVDSGLVGGILDIVTALARLGSTGVGSTFTQIALATSAIWGGGQLLKISKIFDVLGGQFKDVIEFFQVAKIGGATFGEALGASLGFNAPTILAAVAGITLLAKVADKLIVTYDEQKAKVSELRSEYEALYGAESEYEKLREKRNLTDAEQARSNVLEAQEAHDRLEIQKETADLYRKFSNRQLLLVDPDYNERVSKAEGATRKMAEGLISLEEQYNTGKINLEQYKAGIGELTEKYGETYNSIQDFIDAGIDVDSELLALYNMYNTLVDAVSRYDSVINDVTDSTKNYMPWMKEYRDTMASLFNEEQLNAFKTLWQEFGFNASTSLAEMSEKMGITEDGVRAFLGAWGELDGKIYMTVDDMNLFIDQIQNKLPNGYDNLNQVADAIIKTTNETDPRNIMAYVDALKEVGAIDFSDAERDQLFEDLSDTKISIDNTEALDALDSVKNALDEVEGVHTVYVDIVTSGELPSLGSIGQAQRSHGGGGGHFAKGTKNAPEGLSMVNEEGAEIIQSKDGTARIAGGGKPTITMLHAGDKVYTAKQTAQILSNGIESNEDPSVNKRTINDVAVGTIPTVGAGKSSGGSGGATASAMTKDAFDEWLKERKHALNMDLITEQEYYDQLEDMYKKYLDAGVLSQEEAWKYEEEIYKFRKKMLDDQADAANSAAEAMAKVTKVWKDGKWQYVSGYGKDQAHVVSGGIGGSYVGAMPNTGINVGMGSIGNNAYAFNIDNVTLPDVSDAAGFVEGLRNYAYQYAASRA